MIELVLEEVLELSRIANTLRSYGFAPLVALELSVLLFAYVAVNELNRQVGEQFVPSSCRFVRLPAGLIGQELASFGFGHVSDRLVYGFDLAIELVLPRFLHLLYVGEHE